MPTLQQLRYLVALADAQHFRRAAEACHVTQPTLSAQLRQLEARLGAPLLERTRPRVVLTPLGLAVAQRARAALREVDAIRALARGGAAVGPDRVRLGVAQTLGSYLLPLLVPALREEDPARLLASREDAPEALLQGLDAGALDLLVLPLPVPRDDLALRPFFREPLLAVLPRAHPLAARKALDHADLGGEAVLAPGPGHPLHEQLRQICEATGARLSAEHQGANLDGLRQMAAMGMGVALLPALYVRSEVAREDRVVARPFRDPPSRLVGLAWRRGAGPETRIEALVQAMRTILRREVPEVTLSALPPGPGGVPDIGAAPPGR